MNPYTGTDLEGDLARAVLKRWQELAPTIAPLVNGELQQEPRKETPPPPYANLVIEESRRPDEPATGSQWIVYRDPVIMIRGADKAEVARITGIIAGAFFGRTESALPMAGLMRLEPGRCRVTTPQGETHQQQQMHLGTIRMTAWIHWDRSTHGS